MMIDLIKYVIVSIYYIIYLMFEKWMNSGWILAISFGISVGIQLAEKRKNIGKNWKKYSYLLIIIMYVVILFSVNQFGGLTDSIYERILQFVYYVIGFVIILKISNVVWFEIRNDEEEHTEEENKKFYKLSRNFLWGIYGILLIPILMISPYVFPRADDYSFGYRTHLAWESTGSLIELLKAVFEMIRTAYFGWQGTYSSIFLMALQPAVFDEKLYSIVPIFFIIMITFSSIFFIRTVMVEWMKVDRNLCTICSLLYVILIIQCIPVKQSAFLWYNGAIHYIGSHCIFLIMLSFMIKLYIGKKKKRNWVGAALCSIYVGGGNHVTVISTLFVILSIFFTFTVFRIWKKYIGIVTILIINLLAITINILAPGNFNKMGMHQGMHIAHAFIMAFLSVLKYFFGEWMHWTIVVTIAVSIPFIWKITGEINAKFQHPVIFILYSWCYMASMFFTPLFTLGHADTGRFQNMIFVQGVLWLLLDIGYIVGWLQRKYSIQKKTLFLRNEKKYLIMCSIITLGIGVLCIMAEPEKYTSVDAFNTLGEERLHEYVEDYWENVKKLKSSDKVVVIKDLSNIPRFLNTQETEIWHSGLRLFYDKDKIVFVND